MLIILIYVHAAASGNWIELSIPFWLAIASIISVLIFGRNALAYDIFDLELWEPAGLRKDILVLDFVHESVIAIIWVIVIVEGLGAVRERLLCLVVYVDVLKYTLELLIIVIWLYKAPILLSFKRFCDWSHLFIIITVSFSKVDILYFTVFFN